MASLLNQIINNLEHMIKIEVRREALLEYIATMRQFEAQTINNDSLIKKLEITRQNIHDAQNINGFMMAMDIVRQHAERFCDTGATGNL